MKSRMSIALLSGAMLLGPMIAGLRADDTPAAPAKAKARAAAKAAGPKGRLPAHYGDVIDNEQKTKIYAIQAEHDAVIKKLQADLKEAMAKRDAAVAAVLTPAQQEKLAKIEEESKSKRKPKAEAGEKPAEEKPAAEKPAEKVSDAAK